ncbi:unnamed protein product (macronuclear) [Paramecium tetraurelia]|uniref:CBM20 domain-containing protein n=1 Tax=Paramecium tetraurelia TaxID=5888 RepID=A0DF97_PARTE|nr:uncharacterized protein GSPATT00016527001 [Paramecium tetraurelia]CAK81714.1 unnamed protein product [Paramecium tetraurelia]|eukprot:XP_001449111.1 hypothetical protein (macronuclear) [Paramecium tetraurelia strain d4-2]
MIHLKIQFKTEFGQAVYISGNSKYLGQWNPKQAIRMNWTENDIWEVEIAYHKIEYKYFISQYESIQTVLWESGPNRVTTKHTIDVWNYRKVCFQCLNPSNCLIYISGSPETLGKFQKRIRMKNKDGISQYTCLLDVADPQIQYQYHFLTKSEFSSPVQKLDLESEQSYYKDALLVYSDNLAKVKQMIFQLNKNICYGYVPQSKEDYRILKNFNLKTIVEFCNTQEKSLLEHQLQRDDCQHMIVNLYHFKQENFTQRLLQLIQIFIQKYQLIYICNNSLSHLRKYLQVYEKLSK